MPKSISINKLKKEAYKKQGIREEPCSDKASDKRLRMARHQVILHWKDKPTSFVYKQERFCLLTVFRIINY